MYYSTFELRKALLIKDDTNPHGPKLGGGRVHFDGVKVNPKDSIVRLLKKNGENTKRFYKKSCTLDEFLSISKKAHRKNGLKIFDWRD